MDNRLATGISLVSMIFACTINAASNAVQSSRPAPVGVNLTAQFAQQYVLVGTIVRLQAVVKNDSTVSLVLPDTGNATKDFQISVTDAAGNAVPLTSWGRHQLDKPKVGELQSITMSHQRPLQVGDSITYQFVLSRQFDMSNAGTYHVTLTRPGIYTPDGKLCGPIVSNTADITLMEPIADL